MSLELLTWLKQFVPDPLKTSPQMIKYICKDFFEAGWSLSDLKHAVQYTPEGKYYGTIKDGKFVPYTYNTVKNLSRWLTARLNKWRFQERAGNPPVESDSERFRIQQTANQQRKVKEKQQVQQKTKDYHTGWANIIDSEFGVDYLAANEEMRRHFVAHHLDNMFKRINKATTKYLEGCPICERSEDEQ
jgi:hypothetical protein